MFCLQVCDNPEVSTPMSGLLQVLPDIDRISATIPKNRSKRRDCCKIEYLCEGKTIELWQRYM